MGQLIPAVFLFFLLKIVNIGIIFGMQRHMSTCMRTVTLVWLDTLYLAHITFLN
jgi:hypothetical protein